MGEPVEPSQSDGIHPAIDCPHALAVDSPQRLGLLLLDTSGTVNTVKSSRVEDRVVDSAVLVSDRVESDVGAEVVEATISLVDGSVEEVVDEIILLTAVVPLTIGVPLTDDIPAFTVVVV